MPLRRFWLSCVGCVLLVSLLWGCALPQVRAEDRLFLNVSVEYRGELSLPAGTLVDGTVVGGLSGLTYDPQQQQFYAISDDRQQPRFYGLTLSLPSAVSTQEGAIEPEFMTVLTQTNGDLYPPNTADTEGIGLTPDGSLMISSEGVTATSSLPWIKEFALNGQQERALPIPAYYLPEGTEQKGIRNNLGFEALTLSPTGDRLFVGVESALGQDLRPNQPIYCRLLHYLRGDVLPVLLAEHVCTPLILPQRRQLPMAWWSCWHWIMVAIFSAWSAPTAPRMAMASNSLKCPLREPPIPSAWPYCL